MANTLHVANALRVAAFFAFATAVLMARITGAANFPPPEFDFVRYPVLGAPAYVINLATATARIDRMRNTSNSHQPRAPA